MPISMPIPMSMPTLVPTLLDALLRFTVLVSAALLVLAVARPLVRRTLGARATYAAWLLVPLVLASPWLPRVPLGWSVTPLAASMPAEVTTALGVAELTARSTPTLSAAEPATPAAPEVSRAELLAALWVAGAAALAALHWRGQRRYQRALARTADGHWQAPAGHSPAVVGVFPARLVLPQDFSQRFDADSQRLMLAHEAVHQRRHDNAWNLLAATLLCLQWFNPLAWWGARRLRDDQELACDEAVLDSVADPAAHATYTRAMVAAHVRPHQAWLASAWTGGHPLVQRVRLLSRYRRVSRGQRLGALALVVVAGTGAALVARAAQQAPAAQPAVDRPAQGKPQDQGLQFTIASQLGRSDWHHSSLWVPLNRPLVGGTSGVTTQALLPGWCLYLHLHIFDGGVVRPVAQPMDETCKQPIGEPLEVQPNGRVTEFAMQTPQGPLQAQVAMRWALPNDPGLPALTRAEAADAAQLSDAQRAEIAQQRERISQSRREADALDRAWRAAREAQAGTR
ncbi:M56 family metallopeptidase [Pelomonas baiyunensis]|uniref:M56 family metallopeptidase n=1 Tax=Pelomonas baiyunensis TaxID=3299026 RepID=A0ABW7GUS1_9BURK